MLTPDETLALAERLGDHSVLYLNPLLAGIDPAASWKMLRLFERAVRPFLTLSPRGPVPNDEGG